MNSTKPSQRKYLWGGAIFLGFLFLGGIALFIVVQKQTKNYQDFTNQKTVQVVISDFKYKPSHIHISSGTTVTWKNKDFIQHSVTENHKKFNSGLLNQRETFFHTFDESGEFGYYCIPHPWMIGGIKVN